MKLKLGFWYRLALIAADVATNKRVTVRVRMRGRLEGDIAAGARPVVDNKWLAQALRQPMTSSRAKMSGELPAAEADETRTGRVG